MYTQPHPSSLRIVSIDRPRAARGGARVRRRGARGSPAAPSRPTVRGAARCTCRSRHCRSRRPTASGPSRAPRRCSRTRAPASPQRARHAPRATSPAHRHPMEQPGEDQASSARPTSRRSDPGSRPRPPRNRGRGRGGRSCAGPPATAPEVRQRRGATPITNPAGGCRTTGRRTPRVASRARRFGGRPPRPPPRARFGGARFELVERRCGGATGEVTMLRSSAGCIPDAGEERRSSSVSITRSWAT